MKQIYFLFVVLLVVMAACGGKKETSVDAEQLMFFFQLIIFIKMILHLMLQYRDTQTIQHLLLCVWWHC